MNRSNNHDGFKELLHLQELPNAPSFLEQNIMAKIQPAPQRKPLPISLESVFILSSLAALYLLLLLTSIYYFPHYSLLQEARTCIALLFLVKLFFDLNEILPSIIQSFSGLKKTSRS